MSHQVQDSIDSAPQLELAARDRRSLDSDLARWVTTAVRSHRGASRLASYEREALEQEVALRVLRSRARTGSAHDVLAWMDRCERMPLTAAREEAATRYALAALPADERARKLWSIIGHALATRSWQDHSARYRAAMRSQRDTGPDVSPDPMADGSVAHLALEQDSARLGTAPMVGAALPLIDTGWSATDVAVALAYGQGWTTAQARNAALALERARYIAMADAGASRISASELVRVVAAHRGTSVNAVEAAAKRGLALLAAIPVHAVIDAVRHAARIGPSDGPRADQRYRAALAIAAHGAVRSHALAGGSWDSESLRTGRAMPVREARASVPVAGPVLSGPLALARSRRVALDVAPARTRTARERATAALAALARHSGPLDMPAVAQVNKRTSAAVAKTVQRPVSPCRCEAGKSCPIHSAARLPASQRDLARRERPTVALAALWPRWTPVSVDGERPGS